MISLHLQAVQAVRALHFRLTDAFGNEPTIAAITLSQLAMQQSFQAEVASPGNTRDMRDVKMFVDVLVVRLYLLLLLLLRLLLYRRGGGGFHQL